MIYLISKYVIINELKFSGKNLKKVRIILKRMREEVGLLLLYNHKIFINNLLIATEKHLTFPIEKGVVF